MDEFGHLSVALIGAAPPRGGDAGAIWQMLLYAGLLVVVLVIGALVVRAVRGILLDSDSDRLRTPWTLEGLRDLRAAGQITDDEFDRMKKTILGAARRELIGPDNGPESKRQTPINEALKE